MPKTIQRSAPDQHVLALDARAKFLEGKAKASDFLDREDRGEQTRQEGKIDEGIKPLVCKMNRLPFLYTVDSSQGKMFTRESIRTEARAENPDVGDEVLMLPVEGWAISDPGNIDFVVDDSPESARFMERLGKVIKDFPDAKLTRESHVKEGYSLFLSKRVNADSEEDSDMLPVAEAAEQNTLRAQLKTRLDGLVDDFLE